MRLLSRVNEDAEGMDDDGGLQEDGMRSGKINVLLHPTLQIHLGEAATLFLIGAARAAETEEVVLDDGFAFSYIAEHRREDEQACISDSNDAEIEENIRNIMV